MLGSLRSLHTRWNVGREARSTPTSGGLLIFLFHALFENAREVELGRCYPQQGITVTFFREFVESLLDHGLSIQGLAAAVRPAGRAPTAAITFDDGYANNARALPTLERLNVPATFFISTAHVEAGKAFWWDAVFREAARAGADERAVRREVGALKRLSAEEVERQVTARYGPHALSPVSDTDRPFTPDELTRLARSPLVTLGNHTRNHAILVHYGRAGAAAQIREAQRDLLAWTGKAPAAIAYPNGDFDDNVVTEARAAGLEVGVTVHPGLNLRGRPEPMVLRRISVGGSQPAARQAAAFARAARGGHL